MHVFVDRQHWLLGSQPGEKLDQRFECPLFLSLGRHIKRRIALARWDR